MAINLQGEAPLALQSGWRWCNKRQGLFYGPFVGDSRCPAGGAHAAPAQSGNANYSLLTAPEVIFPENEVEVSREYAETGRGPQRRPAEPR